MRKIVTAAAALFAVAAGKRRVRLSTAEVIP